jgi:hypothetical protein
MPEDLALNSSVAVGRHFDEIHVEGHGLLTGTGVLADLAPRSASLRPVEADTDSIAADGWQ